MAPDRSGVLVAAAYAPCLTLRIFVSYLRLRRSANRARVRFLRELIHSGVGRKEAVQLADEYASAVSVHQMVQLAQTGWGRRKG
jgi:hypothetical protein